MGSAPPLPTEYHRLVIVLDGKKLKGRSEAEKKKKYYEYRKEMRKLAKRYGAVEDWTDLYVKDSEIQKRKKQRKKPVKRGGG